MRIIRGYSASPGLGQGRAYVVLDPDLKIPAGTFSDSETEMARLEQALGAARLQLQQLRSDAVASVGEKEASIFDAHALFLRDPSLLASARGAIEGKQINAEAAWSEAIEGYARHMEAMRDETFRARAADIRDVGRRVLLILLGQEVSDLSTLSSPSVVVARDLTPSQTIRLRRDLVLAFATAEGGPTSHTAILAKALGIPAVVAAGSEALSIRMRDLVLVDGDLGQIVVDPDGAALAEFGIRARRASDVARQELAAASLRAVTRDGHSIEVAANVGGVQEAILALQHGAEAIGLLRTEFLYLSRRDPPDEEEQVEAYRSVLNVMSPRPVIFRTLDIGGDKAVGYLNLGKEANPFLGFRAIRVCLDKPDLFKTQLRALLRASPGHDLRIMFPMIATLQELRKAKSLLEQARHEVLTAGHKIAETIEIGIMVEVPSVAVLADLFAREVDFFSVGTNDLTQYTMAAERTNERVAYLGDPCHPAVLRQIRSVVEAGHRAGIWVGVCGELAGDPSAVPILLGLDLDELSMAPGSIPRAKSILRRSSWEDAKRLAAQALDLDSAEAVRRLAG